MFVSKKNIMNKDLPLEGRKLIGVVTVLYNSDNVLPGFFKSLADQQGVRFRLYVVDNGPTDTGIQISRTLAEQYGIDAQYIFNNANLGVAKGNNQGIEMALMDGCDYVLLANNDTEFSSQTLHQLIGALDGGKERVATPKIMYHSDPTLIWYGGGHINTWTMRTPHYGMNSLDQGKFDDLRYVGYAPTCFMMLDVRVFQKVGRMDEKYFVYYDDTDFVWRMSAHGIRILYVPKAIVLHKVSTSTGGAMSPFSVFYTNRNRIYFVRKNLRSMNKLVTLFYILSTRLIFSLKLPKMLRSKVWAGIREGFRIRIERSTL
jgi:GT2 family glycosyltransferase